MDFIRSQWLSLPYPESSFEGQTIIVTGANIGLGLEAARHFTRLGASTVILACRSISKGEEACRSIHESTGRNGICEVWQVDLGDFESVKQFTTRAQKLDRLDVVCENAGIAKGEYIEVEGMESMVAINVVGTFLMALNLLPILRKSGEKTGHIPRLVITSSGVHAASQLDERSEDSIFQALIRKDEKYMAKRYPTSKLLGVFFVRALAEKMLSGEHSTQPVVLNMVDPGLCHSGLARDFKGLSGWLIWVFKLVMARTTEVGSRTLLTAAIAGDESHGKYMTACKVADPSPFVMSDEGIKTQERVYNELVEILERIQPGISKNV